MPRTKPPSLEALVDRWMDRMIARLMQEPPPIEDLYGAALAQAREDAATWDDLLPRGC
jgi:hypothetical protein